MTMNQRLHYRVFDREHLIMAVCNRDRPASKLGTCTIIIIHNRNLQRSGNIRTEFLATLANMDVSKTPRLTCNFLRRRPLCFRQQLPGIVVSPAWFVLRLNDGMKMVAASKKQHSR